MITAMLINNTRNDDHRPQSIEQIYLINVAVMCVNKQPKSSINGLYVSKVANFKTTTILGRYSFWICTVCTIQ